MKSCRKTQVEYKIPDTTKEIKSSNTRASCQTSTNSTAGMWFNIPLNIYKHTVKTAKLIFTFSVSIILLAHYMKNEKLQKNLS